MLNNCFQKEIFPNNWKKAEIIIILKSKDRNPSQPGSYKPIPLLPTIAKIYERIILEKLLGYYNDHGLASNDQFGFKPGKSTKDAIHKLILHTKTTDKKYVIRVFMDIKGAFDNLWWQGILYRITKSNCSNKIFNLIKNYSENRVLVVRSENKEITKKMSKGCPQGSILGPAIWNMVMDNMLNDKVENCEYIAYADDLAIII